MLDWLVNLKEEPRKVKYNFQKKSHLIAHNGISFDTYAVLNGLLYWHRIKT